MDLTRKTIKLFSILSNTLVPSRLCCFTAENVPTTYSEILRFILSEVHLHCSRLLMPSRTHSILVIPLYSGPESLAWGGIHLAAARWDWLTDVSKSFCETVYWGWIQHMVTIICPHTLLPVSQVNTTLPCSWLFALALLWQPSPTVGCL